MPALPGQQRQIEHLRSVRLFRSLSKKDLTAIARAGDEVKLAAGEEFVTEGAEGDAAYVLLEGSVTLKRNNRTLTTLGPGEIIGELAMLDKAPRTATAICDTDCTLFRLDRMRFVGLIESVPALAHKVLQTLASRLRDLDSKYYG